MTKQLTASLFQKGPKKLLLLLAISVGLIVDAQVGINILQPDSSAILHLESTDKGLLLPRLTSPQMDGIIYLHNSSFVLAVLRTIPPTPMISFL